MTLPRFNALRSYWLSKPPVHITAAIFAGIQPAGGSARPLASVTPIDNAAVTKEMHSDPRKLNWRGVRNG